MLRARGTLSGKVARINCSNVQSEASVEVLARTSSHASEESWF